MIRSMFNLVCSEGHRHYSPTPEAFVGKQCFQPIDTNLDAAVRRSKKCSARLVRLGVRDASR